MRTIEIDGRAVHVAVRRSPRARHARMWFHLGRSPELVVPRRTSAPEIDRLLDENREWLARKLAEAPEPKLELPRLTESEGRRRARAFATELVAWEALRLDLTYERVVIRDQRTRWASCSSAGVLSFNWRLALAPHDVFDYVVVHELCHRVELNHSPSFWRLVEAARPDYRDHRRWLHDHGWELQAYEPD